MSIVRDLVRYVLSGLGDVDLTGLAAGKILMYNGTKWVPGDAGSGGGGSVTTTEVLNAVAGASAFSVGTYAFCQYIPPGWNWSGGHYPAVLPGYTVPGSALSPAGVQTLSQISGVHTHPTALSGTWRLLGYVPSGNSIYDDCGLIGQQYTTSLWLRIA